MITNIHKHHQIILLILTCHYCSQFHILGMTSRILHFSPTHRERYRDSDLRFSELNANTTNFLINGPDVSSRIITFSFKDSRCIKVDNLMANFEYTLSYMKFGDLNIKTKDSELRGDLRFDYKREDLKDFTDKVNVTAKFRDSEVSLTELNVFFDEFGTNQRATLNADLSGTLNDLVAKNLNVSTTRNTRIIGDITFKNLFSREDDSFALDGRFQNLASNYNDLTALLPRILGNAIPTFLSTHPDPADRYNKVKQMANAEQAKNPNQQYMHERSRRFQKVWFLQNPDHFYFL